MKIKIRPHDPGVLQENDWLQMDGWLAELRNEGQAGPVGDDQPQPARGGDPGPQALAEPVPAEAGVPAEAPVPAEAAVPAEAPICAEASVRAVIGDQLRMPIMWCELGSCISWRADSAALGEADARARAISAGWRVDALGRLACPRCQQTDPRFWATGPVVRWDRHTAVARAQAAAGRGDGAASANARGSSPSARRWS